MSLCLTPAIEAMARRATGRAQSLFQADLDRHAAHLRATIEGRRVLFAGGAGSIATACLREILTFGPAEVVIVDPSENNAVEVLRWIRSSDQPRQPALGLQPLDFASPLAEAFLARQKPFDLVFSFAALKHVRSERDVFSLLRMCEVNILGTDRFCASLRRHGHGHAGVFFVSTDKAARPTSLMGASKRLMEAVCWEHARPGAPASLLDGGEAPALARITSTRFANVAFSDGSLPWGFLQRIAKRQPLAGPVDVRRYLVTLSEAGQLCLLAALIARSGHVGIPRMDPIRDSVAFQDIARQVLEVHGYGLEISPDEASAKRDLERLAAKGRWPWVGTVSDTSGEKEMEEFVGGGETVLDGSCASMREVVGRRLDRSRLIDLLGRLDAYVHGRAELPTKAALVADFATLIPDLQHRETGASLDGKM